MEEDIKLLIAGATSVPIIESSSEDVAKQTEGTCSIKK